MIIKPKCKPELFATVSLNYKWVKHCKQQSDTKAALQSKSTSILLYAVLKTVQMGYH